MSGGPKEHLDIKKRLKFTSNKIMTNNTAKRMSSFSRFESVAPFAAVLR